MQNLHCHKHISIPIDHNGLAMRSADFEKINFTIRTALSKNLFWRTKLQKNYAKTSFCGLKVRNFNTRTFPALRYRHLLSTVYSNNKFQLQI